MHRLAPTHAPPRQRLEETLSRRHLHLSAPSVLLAAKLVDPYLPAMPLHGGAVQRLQVHGLHASATRRRGLYFEDVARSL